MRSATRSSQLVRRAIVRTACRLFTATALVVIAPFHRNAKDAS